MIAALTPTFTAMTTVIGAVVAQNVFFYLIAVVMVIAALRVVTTSNMVHAALYLVVVLAGVAAQFLLLGAEFVGVTQVLVYIGAVIVLFLFGIMLTRAKVGGEEEGLNHDNLIPAILTAVLLLLVMGFAVVDFAATGGGEVAGLVFGQPHGETVEGEEPTVVPRTVQVFENATDAIESRSFETGVPFGPMEGALVRLVDSDGDTVARMTTAEDGRYRFDGLDTDQYDVVVSQPSVDDVDPATVSVHVDKVKEIDVLNNEPTTVEQVSDSIFSTYIVAFEAISVLLLAALIGAIVVARKE